MVPRDTLPYPPDFGRSYVARFDRPNTPSNPQATSARLQHEFVLEVRRVMKERHISVRTLADRIHIETNRLGRLLRGTTPMRLIDIALIAHALDLSVGLAVDGSLFVPPLARSVAKRSRR